MLSSIGRRRTGTRLAVAIGVTLCLVATTAAASLAAAQAVAPSPAISSSTASAVDEGTALRLAQQSGTRVEVLRLRSETDQVFVNPDGSWTREMYTEPVRVRRGDSWVGVDSTLVRGADGLIRPVAAAVDVELSGGGASPLLSVAKDGVESVMTWPQALPAPTLEGDSATYAEVLPGVDLVVSVPGTAVSERLVVKSREAAQNPALRSLKLGMIAHGGKVKPLDDGGYSVVDNAGVTRFKSPAPLMWDTAGTGAAAGDPEPLATPKSMTGSSPSAVEPSDVVADPGASLDGPQEGDRTAPMDQSWSGSTMTVTPDADLLDAASTVYPVIVDPVTAPAGIHNWAMIDKTYPTTRYYNWSDQDQGVGYQNFSGISTKRLFFGFNTTFLAGKDVTDAALYVYETYSATCSAGTVDVYLSGNVTSSTTWNAQPARSTGVVDSITTKAGRSDCRPGGYLADLDVESAVQTRATQKASVTTFSLAGRSESTYSSWMRIAGPRNSTVDRRPRLSVTYNSPPNQPATSKMAAPSGSSYCATSPTSPKVLNPTSSNAFFYGTGSDPEGGTIWASFYVNEWKSGVSDSDWPYLGYQSAGSKAGTTSAGALFLASMKASSTLGALTNGKTALLPDPWVISCRGGRVCGRRG